MAEILMYFDGASKENPGNSGAGYWINNGSSSHGGYKYLGIKTNNEAEYNGLILGLKNLPISEHSVKVYGDSKLVIQQMKGIYKVKAENLKPLWKEAQELIKNFKKIEFIHIDRSLNSKADNLANIAVTTQSFGNV